VPLLTGPLAGTNFGVVVTFKLPLVFVFAVGVLVVAEVAELLAPVEELVEELLDDPQPANAGRAAHKASVARRLPICRATLA
jgi:hypothetical protein